MNKFLALSTIAGALIFTGCAKTTAFDFFATDSYYEKSIANMQKASLMRDMETKALLHAVYLNNVDPTVYNGDEYFYVTVHIIEDAYDPKKHGLRNLDYNLRMEIDELPKEREDETKLPEYDKDKISPFADSEVNQAEEAKVSSVKEVAANGKKIYVEAIEITELDEYDKLRRTMPIQQQWNHFYLVRFQKTESSTINLIFENDRYGRVQLAFQKER